MLWLWLTSLLYPLTLNSAKLQVFNRFTEAPCDNLKFGSIFNYFTLCLTDNFTRLTSLQYPQTFSWAKLSTLNMFSKVPHGQINKRKLSTLLFDLIYIDMA